VSWFHANLCAYCAGSSGSDGVVDEDLTREWKIVLPTICLTTCRADGALPLDRTRRRNGAANGRRAQRARLAASIASQSLEAVFLSVEVTNIEVVPVVPVEPVQPNVRLTGRRGRRNPPVATVARTRKASSHRVAGA
jgi:hypothetical protein